MELFSEIYGCYYQVLRSILNTAYRNGFISKAEILDEIKAKAFAESIITIPDRLESGSWGILQKKDGGYANVLDGEIKTPISSLLKAYLKTIILDPKIRLFLDDSEINELKLLLKDAEPIWSKESIRYIDRFEMGDSFEDEAYRANFRMLLKACKEKKVVKIEYKSKKGESKIRAYLPGKIEYSEKNDRMRLYVLNHFNGNSRKDVDYETLNLQNVVSVELSDDQVTEEAKKIDINEIIERSYCKEPVRILIRNERNAMERAMLHFANYAKNTTKIDDNTYECLIKYNKSIETELLIEVMSFGPLIRVTGNECFLAQLKERLAKQKLLW